MKSCGNNYTVYEHIFPDGKSYVGITGLDVGERWREGTGYSGQTKMAQAISEFGWENVTHRVIAERLTLGEACALERATIRERDSVKHGYNAHVGGQPPPHANLLSPSVNHHLLMQRQNLLLRGATELADLIRSTAMDSTRAAFWNDADQAIVKKHGSFIRGVDGELQWWQCLYTYCNLHIALCQKNGG